MSVGQPLVSVIINCFNGERYIRQAIESVLNQTFQAWDLLIWDNRSTDGTRHAVESYLKDPRIRYHYAEEHTTLGQARNLAVRQVTGDWIGFLDVDDIWLSQKLEEQVRLVQSAHAKDVGLVYCRTKLMFDSTPSNEDYCRFYKDKTLPEGEVLTKLLLVENFIPLVSALIKRDIFCSSGGIPAHLKQAEDLYLFCLIAEKWTVKAWQGTGCYYRIHDMNLSKKQRIEELEELVFTLERFQQSIPQVHAQSFRAVMKATLCRREFIKLRTWRRVRSIQPALLFKEVYYIIMRRMFGSAQSPDYKARLQTMAY